MDKSFESYRKKLVEPFEKFIFAGNHRSEECFYIPPKEG